MRAFSQNNSLISLCAMLLAGLLLGGIVWGTQYQKADPPADVNKLEHDQIDTDDTCWLATASNMLAAAGYGASDDIHVNADEIFRQMVDKYGINTPGHIDKALKWWLCSSKNEWPTNPYKLYSIQGIKPKKENGKWQRYPWIHPQVPKIIANRLRDCSYVGVSLSWPTSYPDQVGLVSHTVTAWGDELGPDSLIDNPSTIRITDSDNPDDATNIPVQECTYFDFNDPASSGINEGAGWYLDYYAQEDPFNCEETVFPYIKYIVSLHKANLLTPVPCGAFISSSYRTLLHEALIPYFLSYSQIACVDFQYLHSEVDWPDVPAQRFRKLEPGRKRYDISWDLSGHPITGKKEITFSTLSAHSGWGGASFQDVRLKGKDSEKTHTFPDISWKIESQEVPEASKIPFASGGYFLGAFDIYASEEKLKQGKPTATFRFSRQYHYMESPEHFKFELKGTEGCLISNLRFGHSYGHPETNEIWRIKEWMTEFPKKIHRLGSEPIVVKIDWTGRLPYPQIGPSPGSIDKK